MSQNRWNKVYELLAPYLHLRLDWFAQENGYSMKYVQVCLNYGIILKMKPSYLYLITIFGVLAAVRLHLWITP